MKKLFTILTVVTLTTTISFAQAQFGVKAGFNSSVIGSSESESNEMMSSRVGLQFGGVATIPFTDAVQLRTGAIYNQKGGTIDFLGGDITLAIDYLEVPLDFAFMLGDGGFALSAGPYFAFLMNSKLKFDGESEGIDNMKATDIGLNFGASFTIQESMIIDARYGMGLTNLSDDSTLADDYVELNGVLSVSFAYMFGSRY